MTTPTLNPYCYNFGVRKDTSGTIFASAREMPVHAARANDFAAGEEWDLDWSNLGATDATAIDTIYLSVGYTGTVAWTPPDDSTPRAFRFTAYEPARIGPNQWRIRARLRRRHGVALVA